jgi:hypothetical protein
MSIYDGFLQNSKAIIYFKGKNGAHWKLQPVAVDSSMRVELQWAVDSAGNGLFKTPPLSTAPERMRSAISRLPGLQSSRQWFDIRGRFMRGNRESGIYIDPGSGVETLRLR